MEFVYLMLALIVGDALLDYFIEKNEHHSPNHTTHLLTRYAVGITGVLLLSHFHWKEMLVNAIFGATTFTFFFPLLLNKLRGKGWMYLSDRGWDKWLKDRIDSEFVWFFWFALLAFGGIILKIQGWPSH